MCVVFDFCLEDVKKKWNMIRKVKDEIKFLFYLKEKYYCYYYYCKDFYGSSDDIDENMYVDEVKGFNVFDRVEEEIEVVVIYFEKNEIDGFDFFKSFRFGLLEKERVGLGCFFGKWFEKICVFWGDNKKD